MSKGREWSALLAAELGHEVKNVVMIIHAIAPTLVDELPPDGSGVALVEDLLEAAQRATRLSHRLMQLARDTSPDGPTDLVAAVARQVSALRHVAKETVAIELDAPETAVATRLSDVDAQQIVFNLALNAFDAMGDSGNLTISLRRVDGMAELVVRDDGAGMDATTLRRCAKPFFTTKGDLGSGLGLHVVRQAVEHAGGHIAIDSRPGEGTTVAVYLPVLVPAS